MTTTLDAMWLENFMRHGLEAEQFAGRQAVHEAERRAPPLHWHHEFHGNTEFQQWVVHHIRDIHREVGTLLAVTHALVQIMELVGQKVTTEMATKEDVAQTESDLEAAMDAAFAGVHAKLDTALARIDELVAAGQTFFTPSEVQAILDDVRTHVPAGDIPPPAPAE